MRSRKSVVLTILAMLLFSMVVMAWTLYDSRTRQLFGPIVHRVDTDSLVIALTFDDGPSTAWTDSVLTMLADLDVRGTFFLTGHELARRPELGRRILAAGHAVGNHSWSHERLLLKSRRFVRGEVARTDSLLRGIGADNDIPFRPPYGVRLWVLPRYLAQTGRTTVMWDIEPESYPEVAGDAQSLTRHVLDRARPGSILLLHLMYDSRAVSRQALPAIVDSLRARGFGFATVPELLALREEP